jgi:hypothetical protein
MTLRSWFSFRPSEPVRLYRALAKAHAGTALQGPLDRARGTRYVVYSRGCGGGASLLIREEAADGTCRSHAVLATYMPDGIEHSSFDSPAQALAFVADAVDELLR